MEFRTRKWGVDGVDFSPSNLGGARLVKFPANGPDLVSRHRHGA